MSGVNAFKLTRPTGSGNLARFLLRYIYPDSALNKFPRCPDLQNTGGLVLLGTCFVKGNCGKLRPLIHITKSGFKCFEWDSDLCEYRETPFDSIACLRLGVTAVEDGVTLADIVTFTAQDEFLRSFIGAYSRCNVQAFYDELRKGTKPLTGEVQSCTVALEVQVSQNRKHKIEKTVDVTTEFYGRGNGDKQWALDLAPLAEIAMLPFRLEANATVTHLTDQSYEVEDKMHSTLSLLEILDAIFFDIGFHGSPTEKAGRLLDIEDAIEKIKDGIAKVLPWKPKETIN